MALHHRSFAAYVGHGYPLDRRFATTTLHGWNTRSNVSQKTQSRIWRNDWDAAATSYILTVLPLVYIYLVARKWCDAVLVSGRVDGEEGVTWLCSEDAFTSVHWCVKWSVRWCVQWSFQGCVRWGTRFLQRFSASKYPIGISPAKTSLCKLGFSSLSNRMTWPWFFADENRRFGWQKNISFSLVFNV